MSKEIIKEKIEREYIIPLRKKVKVVPRYKKANKAIKTIKEFLVRHMKIRDRDLNKIKLDKYVNEHVWHRGIRKPPSKIKVKVVKEGDIVNVSLLDMPRKLRLKKLREEKFIKSLEAPKKKKIEKPKKEESVEEEKELEKEKEIIKESKNIKKKPEIKKPNLKIKKTKRPQRKVLNK